MNTVRSAIAKGGYHPLKFAQRSGRKIIREARYGYQEILDRRRSTHLDDDEFIALSSLDLSDSNSWLNLATGLIDTVTSDSEKVDPESKMPGFRIVADKSRRHVFSLLGSGDAEVHYDADVEGAFGQRYETCSGT